MRITKPPTDPTAWHPFKINRERAGWAKAALHTFVQHTVFGKKQQAIEERQGYMISDLICDCLHLAASRGFDPAEVLRLAQGHFEFESVNDDGSSDWVGNKRPRKRG